MKRLSSKIFLVIFICSTLFSSLIGIFSIIRTSSLLQENARTALLDTVQINGGKLDKESSRIEMAVQCLAGAVTASFDREKSKDAEALQKYTQETLEPFTSQVSQTVKGITGVYTYLNVEMFDEVYAAWFYKDDASETFKKYDLSEDNKEAYKLQNRKTDDSNNLEWYSIPVHDKKAVWKGPYLDDDINVRMISYVAPIWKDDTVIGVSGIDLSFEGFEKLVNSTTVFDNGYSFLLDSDYTFIIPPRWVDKDAFDAADNVKMNPTFNLGMLEDKKYGFLTEAMAKEPSGILEYDRSGQSFYLSYFTLSNGQIICATVAKNEALKPIEAYRLVLFTILLLGIGATVVAGLVVSRSISNPIIDIVRCLKHVSEGDFTVGTSIRSRDEIGLAGKSLNDMIARISGLLGMVKISAGIVTESSGLLNKAMESSKTNFNQIAHMTKDMSEAAMEHASEVENSMNRIQLLGSRIDSVANEVESISHAAAQASDLSSKGIGIVNSLIDNAMVRQEKDASVYESIIAVDKIIQEIMQITESISEIAGHTNLLSLNALIESARAGETGKGFAVVADEIGKLSGSTKTMSNTINHLIGTIHEKSRLSILHMEDAKALSQEEQRSVGETEQIFSDIKAFINELHIKLETTRTDSIAMEKQKDEIIQISGSLSAISEQTAASVEDIRLSVGQELESVEHSTDHTGELMVLVERLEEALKEFRTKT